MTESRNATNVSCPASSLQILHSDFSIFKGSQSQIRIAKIKEIRSKIQIFLPIANAIFKEDCTDMTRENNKALTRRKHTNGYGLLQYFIWQT